MRMTRSYALPRGGASPSACLAAPPAAKPQSRRRGCRETGLKLERRARRADGFFEQHAEKGSRVYPNAAPTLEKMSCAFPA